MTKTRVKLFIIAICIVMTIMTFSSLFTSSYAFAEENELLFKQETINDFLAEDQSVYKETAIMDFSGNCFMVYELLPKGYAIYSINEESSIFLEGSYEDWSPYFDEYDKNLYHVGPGDYYSMEDGIIMNLLSEEIINYDSIPHTYLIASEYYLINQTSSRASFPSKPDTNKTHTDNGFTVINNDDYFRGLTKFPNNTKGTCGLVALSILLGYFDNFVDQGFITDSSYISGNGTSQASHDYLFDSCMHTILGIGGDSGYPMAGYELRETMKDYLANKCTSTLKNKVKHEYGSLFYTHANPRKHINGGYPTLLVLTSYNETALTRNKGEKDKNHVVVAYGYNATNDTFLAHMGWSPNSTDYAARIISNATIHSYYTINYTA